MEGLSNYGKDERPWGGFERFTLNEPSTVKIITVKPGEAFSLQTHELRDEFWRVTSGSGTFRVGDEDCSVREGDTAFIPRGTKHRATAGADGLSFLEIAFGHADEEDIVRIEDKYGRA
ncbi:MAG: phosphomannose isomerase type II C-terminal cupin domain [Minisyncoccia bacterium]